MQDNIRFSTRNNLPIEYRNESIDIMTSLLASLLDISGLTKQSHWNIKGETFIAEHKLFDEFVETLNNMIDELAERIVALGGFAKGNALFICEYSLLEPLPEEITTAEQYLKSLADRYSVINRYMLYAIDSLDYIDKVSSNIIQEQLHAIDKILYFIESHLN